MVTNLFIKKQHNSVMQAVTELYLVKDQGVQGNMPCAPFRHILINTQDVLQRFCLEPGALWENVIIDGIDLYQYPSGTILNIGTASVRLTFHCEPCFKIKHKVKPSDILHQRGYLGQVMNGGMIGLGDRVYVGEEQTAPIPYDPVERIKWFIRQQHAPVLASQIVWAIGLAPSYCRALPAIIRKHSDIDPEMILFKNASGQPRLF